MAEDDNDRRERLTNAVEGGVIHRSRLEELQEGARTDVDNIVRFIRQIPADDIAKKRELAKYFQTSDGQRYSAKERLQKYEELLGRNRNKRTFG